MDSTRKNVLICDTQPVAVEGMKWLIDNSEDLRFAGSVANLELLQSVLVRPVVEGSGPTSLQIDAVIVDKAFGMVEVMEFLRALAADSQRDLQKSGQRLTGEPVHFWTKMFETGWKTDSVVGVKTTILSETNPHEHLTSGPE